MTTELLSDFVVETNDYCFLCLNEISAFYQSGSPLVYSLQYLSRFLKMDLQKVLLGEVQVQHPDLKYSRLKASLCQRCAIWNHKISELYRQLEKIKMEAMFYIEMIHAEMLRSEGKTDTFLKLLVSKSASPSELSGTMGIVKSLRTEALQKCSRKMRRIKPKVAVEKLPEWKLFRKTLNSKCNLQTYTVSDSPDLVAASSPSPASENLVVVSTTGNYQTNSQIITTNFKIECSEETDGNYQEDLAIPNKSRESSSVTKNTHANAGLSNPKKRKATENKKGGTVAEPSMSGWMISSVHLNRETERFKCSLCPLEFSSKKNCQSHYKSVHLNIRHKCDICGKLFSYRQHYNRHYRSVHSGVRFKCNICNKIFTQKSHLNRHHQVSHLGRLFQCKLCPMSFTQPNYRTRHVRSEHCSDIS